jgi:hypothetical protein
VHHRVLVADLTRLDEIAESVGNLLHRTGSGRLARTVAGHHEDGVEGTGQPGAHVGLAIDEGVARQLQAAVQRAGFLATHDAAHGVAGTLDLLGGGTHLDLEDAIGDLTGQNETQHQDHGKRQPQSQRHHPQLQ